MQAHAIAATVAVAATLGWSAVRGSPFDYAQGKQTPAEGGEWRSYAGDLRNHH